MKFIGRRNQRESPHAEAVEVELTQRQQTLFIGGLFSVCGNCEGNADLSEFSHTMEIMRGEGCGVVFKYVTTDVPGFDFSYRRPDLIRTDRDSALDGITNTIEERMINGLDTMEILPTSEVLKHYDDE